MATSQSNNPGGTGGNLSSKDLAVSIKKLIEDQGDYNNLLKDALKDANKMDAVYKRIQARIESMNMDTINVKRVSSELYSLKQKELIARKNTADIEKNISESTKNELAQRDRLKELLKNSNDAEKTKRIIKQLSNTEARIASNLELKSLEIAKQGVKIAEEETKKGEKALELEKMVSKQMGISGNLMKGFATKLGVGEEAYNAMTLAARKTVDETGKVTNPGKWQVLKAGLVATKKAMIENIKDPAVIAGAAIAGVVGTYKLLGKGFDAVGSGAKKAMSMVGAEEGPITKLASGFSNILKTIPLIGGFLGGMVDSFAMLLDFATSAGSKIHEIGRQIGLSAEESKALSNNYYNIANASGKAYLNNMALLKTQVDLNRALEDTNKISAQNVITAYELQKFAGIELDTISKIEVISRITGKSQSNIAGAVMHQINNFKRLTGFGFSFQSIMKEVANLSGYLGLQLAKYPGKIINSIVAAKGLGLELKQLDGMADSFLDFETSINKQFEAQILTGKEVNLNKARELFLNNQLVEAGMEITKQIGSSNEYLKMNRIAAGAYAEQFGMTRDQMGDFLKQQEHLAAFGVKDVKELQKKVALMKEQGRSQEAINKLGSEESFNKYVTATATEKLSGFIDKIKEALASLVANTGLDKMVTKMIDFLAKPDNIVNLLNKVKNVFGSIVSVIGAVMGGIMKAINYFAGSWLGETLGMGGIHIDESLIDMAESAGATIKKMDMGNLGGGAPSIEATKVNAARKSSAKKASAPTAVNAGAGAETKVYANLYLDGEQVYASVDNVRRESPRSSNDYSRMI